MAKVFSTQCYCSQEKGKMTLTPFQGKLGPGEPFTPDKSTNALLAGGFPELSPDSPIPLSPTLQLQSDLSSFSQDELLQVAEAELFRFESTQCSSYQVDIDTRVCVIGRKASLLEQFIDTFGGVLAIQPLLLEDSHPGYPTVTSLSISGASHGCRIDYQQKSPVNKGLCTYCGECGRVCPESCISPHLYIDYRQCSLCKECEKVCETNAIDIHAIVENSIDVPAIILLGDVDIELPVETSSIYRDNQLPKLFSSLYSADIQEVVCHNNSICQYSGHLDSGCTRCISSCEYGALSRHEAGIRIDHLLCEECGNCIAVCPTGAMQNGYFTDQTLLGYLEKLQAPEGKDLVIGDEQALHQYWWKNTKETTNTICYLEYPGIQSLSWFHLLLFFAVGYRRVLILENEPMAEPGSLHQNVAKANGVVASLFSHEHCFFIATQHTCKGLINSATPLHPLEIFFNNSNYANRRSVLANILKLLLMASENNLNTAGLPGDFFALDCREAGCTQCLACLNTCKTGALQADENNLTLTYDAGLCVGCGLCAQVCPEKVLSLSPCEELGLSYFTRSQLAKAEPVACKDCGEVFGTRKSLERVMQILSAREPVNQDHFEYCSTCRVKNLFEVKTS